MGQTQQFTYQVCTRLPCTNKSASYIYTVENIKGHSPCHQDLHWYLGVLEVQQDQEDP